MSGSRKDRPNLLFHTKVLGRSDQEAMIRDYCSSLDAAWAGIEHLPIGGHPMVPLILNPPPEAWSCNLGLFSANGHHPAEALVLACLRAVGVNEEELK